MPRACGWRASSWWLNLKRPRLYTLSQRGDWGRSAGVSAWEEEAQPDAQARRYDNEASGALLPHFVGEKVAETADGWAAYREARPGGGVEVSWRRKVTPEHTEQHAAGTAFNASNTSVTLAQVVSGTGDGCISSFNVGAPKWAKAGNGDTARLQMSSFSKHRVGEAS